MQQTGILIPLYYIQTIIGRQLIYTNCSVELRHCDPLIKTFNFCPLLIIHCSAHIIIIHANASNSLFYNN